MSWFVLRVFHRGHQVWAEAWKRHGPEDARRLASYLALAAAREAVHPSEFDAAQVYWAVDGVGSGQAAVRPQDVTRVG